MKKHLRSLISSSSLAFLTACSHVPNAQKTAKIDESASRERLILNATVEKVAAETAIHTLLYNSNIMSGYAHNQVIYAQSTCVPYAGNGVVEYPIELKEAYAKTLYKLHGLNALSENDVQTYQKATDVSIDKIQRNLREIRSYCQMKFGS